MQTILSSRGLAALAWVSTFAALWVDAFGLFPSPGRFWIVFILFGAGQSLRRSCGKTT